jgi:hypothetical protein
VLTGSIWSLRLVGGVFEVRTQVDRGLTIVSRVDRPLWLNKNLGRHTRETVIFLDRWLVVVTVIV